VAIRLPRRARSQGALLRFLRVWLKLARHFINRAQWAPNALLARTRTQPDATELRKHLNQTENEIELYKQRKERED
jgi:hypothetical protein